MNTSSLSSQQPQPIGGTDHLEMTEPPAAPPRDGPVVRDAVDWDEVHRLIQRVFDDLASRVCEQSLHIRAMNGRTAAQAFPLFSYRTFDIPTDHAIESIAAGVDFQKGPGDDSVTVRGDIVREDTGDILFETEQRVVPLTRTDVFAAAEEASRALSQQAAVILDGLEQPCVPEAD
jgi:hypothetical protein